MPLPRSVARAVERHMQLFAPVPVALPWDDPRPPETPLEAKHRRPRTYSLLVTGRERKAINRNFFNSRVWTPALAEGGRIAPFAEGARGGSRGWEPSREHGFDALLCATSAPPRSWRPGNRPSPSHAGSGTPTQGSRCGSTPPSCLARAHGAPPPIDAIFAQPRAPRRLAGKRLAGARHRPKVPEKSHGCRRTLPDLLNGRSAGVRRHPRIRCRGRSRSAPPPSSGAPPVPRSRG